MKNIYTRVLLQGALVLLPTLIFSQSFKYRNYDFHWYDGKPEAIPLEERFKNEDAVILREDNQVWIVRDNKFYRNATYTKHIRIKLLTQNGVRHFSAFVLPESEDYQGDYRYLPQSKRDSLHRPQGEFECVKYFAARIIKSNGNIEKAEVEDKTETTIFRRNNKNEEFYNWIFKIKNVSPGDEIEAEYSYEDVWNITPSLKIFFNGIVPKQNYHLSMRWRNEDHIILTYHNGADPTDSTMASKDKDHFTEYVFTRKNLNGGINESGSKAYLELPYITYYIHHEDYGESDEKTGFIKKVYPYPWNFFYRNAIGYEMEDLNLYLSKRDNTTLMLNSFFNGNTHSIDTSALSKFINLHHFIVSEFEYQKDVEYYQGDDQGLEKLGNYIEEHKIRDISRHHFYKQLMLRLKTEYYITEMFDNRYFRMDVDRYEPESASRLFYALPYQNNIVYFYPKTARFGYESNELPYYYENVDVCLIPQLAPNSEKGRPFPHVRFIFTKTPSSNSKDNTRSAILQADVSVDELKTSFSGKLKLSGQFSTLTRGFYLYNDVDTTVNPNYYTHIYDIENDVQVTKKQLNSFDKNFPFKANFDLNYSAKNIRKENEEYILSMNNWFNNVIDDNFSAVNRRLAYYPDFQSQDQHQYLLKFDKEVELLNASEWNSQIDNGYASYTSKITQLEPKSVLIEVNYLVKAEKVPAENAQDVETVFDQIRKLNKGNLRFKVKT